MNSTSRRAVRLASALVATGLALTCAPAVHAEDGQGILVLTQEQAEVLQKQARFDPYATADTAPTGETAPEEGETTDGGDATAEDGTAATGSLKITETSSMESVRGTGDTVALDGTDGDYLAINSLGVIQRLDRDGDTVWTRSNSSYYEDDWSITPIRPWQTQDFPARVVMGYNAVSPFTPASDLGYSTGDLTGDGVADLAVSLGVGENPYRPFTSPGSTLQYGTFVSVLDGATGRTLWTRLYARAGAVHLQGDTLIVADSPGSNTSSPAAATTTLQAVRFTKGADGTLTAADAWTYDTGVGDNGAWGGLQELPGNLLAVSHNARKTPGVPGLGQTLVLDVTDGSVRWKRDSPLYSRQLRHDAGRDRVVAVEQSDHTDGVRYEVVAYDVTTGTRTVLDSRINALPLALTVGDLRGGKQAEYVVSESTLDAGLFLNSSSVRALDGEAGTPQLWSHTLKRAAASGDTVGIWGVEVVDGKVVLNIQDDSGRGTSENRSGTRFARVAALDGRSGAVRWLHQGLVGSGMTSQLWKDRGGAWRVRTVDGQQNILDYRLRDGAVASVTPLRGDVAFARATDVDGDGRKDLVMGGESRGLWAYDGPSLTSGQPKLLWKATLPGAVHGIEFMDADGDGRDELLIAADTAAVVVNSADGSIRTTVDSAGRYVHTVTGADLDGDGKDEIVVPTDQVRAYDAAGSPLWAYAADASDVVFSNAVVTDGRVHVQWNSRGSLGVAAPSIDGVALDTRTGTELWRARPTSPVAGSRLWAAGLRNAVFASPDIPYADGHAVVHTWFSRDNVSWPMITEIRDGRTGEVLRTTVGGTFLLHGNFFTAPGTLFEAGKASVRAWTAGQDHRVNTLPTIDMGGLMTGPDGRRLLIGSGQDGAAFLWEPTMPTAGTNYAPVLARFAPTGAERALTADLDGDQVDEIVALAPDHIGYDRVAELSGGGLYLNNNSTHVVAVGKLTTG
ncbi:FG-GAP-like repeat-containing protein [Streptomyces sp. NPDC051742]|uniref:FG-GAP-like repeat-containing protein n=1 Tax=unclassified Streptomyces TaxID=2593676 RepID=UPI00341757E2